MAKRKAANLDEIGPVTVSQINRAERQEKTRSWIALGFVGMYLAVIVFLISLTAWHHFPADSVKDYLLALGSSLGFIIGFYFSSGNNQ